MQVTGSGYVGGRLFQILAIAENNTPKNVTGHLSNNYMRQYFGSFDFLKNLFAVNPIQTWGIGGGGGGGVAAKRACAELSFRLLLP